MARDSDISSQGAVISANQIVGNVDGLNNSGVIAGRNLTRIYSNQLENQGTILGETVDLSTQQNLINLGGRIEAVKSLSLSAGKNLEISSTLSSAESADGNFARTVLDRLASVKVSGEGGQLNLQSAGNLTVKAAQLESQGRLNANAGDALHITTLTTQNKEHYNGDADNYYRLDQKAEVGSTLTGKEGISLVANHDVTLRQAEISSEAGKVLIGSKTGDIVVEAGQAEEQLATSMKSKSKGLFSKTTTVSRHFHDTTNAVASNVDGQAVSLIAQQGNISVKGSNVVAEQDLTLMAKENVSIVSDVNTHYQEDYSKTTKSGLMGSGGIGFTIGNRKETTEQDRTQESAASSQVGSLKGNTTIQAGNHYQQTGSMVTSQAGDVDIFAQTADITAARSDYESNYKYTMEQKGVTIALTGAVAAAIQAVDSTVKSAKSVGSSKNNRVNAMATANAGFEALRAAEQLQGVAQAVSNGSVTGGAVGVSITYGQQKTEQTQHSEGNTAEKSQVNAGGKVNIQATGKGEQSHLTIKGADVSGQGGTHLKADGDVNIQAVDENHLERSKNKSSGFNVGVAIQFGNGIAAGVTAGGNVAKGYGNGESQAWVASQVGDKNSHTTIESGKDTNVIGSQVKGKRVEVSAENLNIESLQDTAKYEGKQESASGQVTVGYGVSAGGSYSKSKVNSNYASVKTQAGIYAGDEGYDVDVRKHTELTGGLVTSTNKAETEGKNRFSTGTLNATEIENHADYQGSGISVSGSAAMNFDTPLGNSENGIAQSNKQAVNEKGEKIYLDSQGNETTEAKTGGQANQAKLATGLASLTGGVNIGYGSDGDSQRSRTKSGINTANIDIRDSQAQQTKTGKTVEEIRAQVKTEIHTDNAESYSGKLENRFDKAAVQNELDYQVKVLQEFDKNRKEVTDYFYKKAEENRAEAVEIRKTTEINGKTGYNTEVSLELERKADIYDSIALGTDLVLGATYGWGNSNLLNYAGIGAVTTPVVNVATAPEQIWVTTCQQDSLYCADNNMDGSKRPTESGKVQIGDKRQIFDITEIKPSETSGVITLSNNGILNPLDDALKNAIKQNKWETNKEGIVVVYNRPTGNYVSELLYAAYDKTNDLLGGRLPLTTAEKANLKLYGYAKQNNYALDISSHSRGGLTASVALQEANRIGLNNIPIRESRFFGTATNVKDYAGYLKENNPNAVVKSAVHYSDFVGRSPLVAFRSKYIVGGNEPTGGVENTWFTYSHSSYFAERPNEYLINEKGQYIDLKGNRIDEKNKIENEYLKEFNTIWAPIDKQNNPSLPEVINSKQGDK